MVQQRASEQGWLTAAQIWQTHKLTHSQSSMTPKQDKLKGAQGQTHPIKRTGDGGRSLEAVRGTECSRDGKSSHEGSSPDVETKRQRGRRVQSESHVGCSISRNRGKTNRLGGKKRGGHSQGRKCHQGDEAPEAGAENRKGEHLNKDNTLFVSLKVFKITKS